MVEPSQTKEICGFSGFIVSSPQYIQSPQLFMLVGRDRYRMISLPRDYLETITFINRECDMKSDDPF